jgi:hypothetical protein
MAVIDGSFDYAAVADVAISRLGCSGLFPLPKGQRDRVRELEPIERH